jgi:hypothetical protein
LAPSWATAAKPAVSAQASASAMPSTSSPPKPRTIGTNHQRQPAQAQQEEELLDELRAVRKRRPNGRDERLGGQDHHVPDLFERALRGQEDPIGCCSDHCL